MLAYLESFCSFTVESQTEADFAILFEDLKRSLSPFSGSPFEAVAADLDSATTGEFGHCGCHGLRSRWYTLEARTSGKSYTKTKNVYNVEKYTSKEFQSPKRHIRDILS